MHPPHVDDIFTLSSPPGNSRRTSNNSTEQSIGLGSMSLTHTSISEIPSGTGSLDKQENKSRQQSSSYSQIPKYFRSERGRMGGRTQVAPAWPTSTPVSSNSPPYRQSYDAEPSTLPRSFKTTTSSLSNSWNHTQMARELERTEPVGEEEPHPIPPPRSKKKTLQRSPTTPPGRGYASQRTPSRSPSKPGLRHSKTFMVQGRHHPAESPRGSDRYLQGKACRFSRSMGTLAKPLIEPKVSLSNPNVIHV